MRRLALLLSFAGPLGAQGDIRELRALQPVLYDAVARTAPSVVTVETFGGTRRPLAGGAGAQDAPAARGGQRRRRGSAAPGFQPGQGATAGLVIGTDGWILVSRFALSADPATILVTLADGRVLQAERRGEDTSRGIALLEVEADGLPVPELIDPDAIRVGQWAFALGRTFGPEEPTVHMGIVSALRRQFGRAVQVDAYTSPANYGGPVIDVEGRVMGLAVPLSAAGRDAGVEWYDSGIGFAATLADIGDVLERMKRGEVLHRGWLGVITVADHLGPGAALSFVPRDGVAHGAGLRAGDTILQVDGIDVQNGFHLQRLISSRMAGDPLHLVVWRRDSDPVRITVFLAEVPESERRAEQAGDLRSAFPWEGRQE